MKVGIYSNNAQVNTALVSMCASCGCKVQKIINYNKELLKGSDMVLIDLDNCEDNHDILKEDVQTMPEIVFIGISKNLDLIDDYRGIMNVERKPFSNKIFKHYKDLVLKRLESNIVITKEENRIYDEFGLNLGMTFSESNIAIEDRLSILKKTIEETSNYEPEEIFLKKIGLGDIEHQEGKKINLEVLDIRKEIENDAIMKYRIRKLKNMNLTNKDIDDKIKEFINANIQVSVTRPTMNDGEKDILERLRGLGQKSGSFWDRKKELENTRNKTSESIPKATSSISEPPKKESVTTEPKVVEAPKVEIQKTPDRVIINKPKDEPSKVVQIREEEKQGRLFSKPIIKNHPPLKKEDVFKKPIVELPSEKASEIIIGSNEPEEDKKISMVEPPKKPLLSKPKIQLDETGSNPKPTMLKPLVVLEDDNSNTKNEDTDVGADNPKADNETVKITEDIGSNTDTKTNTANINGEKIIKDNREMDFGTSLVDKMKEQIDYINTHRQPRRDTPSDIANRKSKPPR